MGVSGSSAGKESVCNAGDLSSKPVGNIPLPWREWQPTLVFLPGESPWTEEPGGLQSMGHKESDTTEQLSTAQHVGIQAMSQLIEKDTDAGKD